MENMALILMLAVTAEGLVEYGKSVGKATVERQAKTAVTQIGAVIVSVLLCFAAGADCTRPSAWSWYIPGLGYC